MALPAGASGPWATGYYRSDEASFMPPDAIDPILPIVSSLDHVNIMTYCAPLFSADRRTASGRPLLAAIDGALQDR